MAGEKKSRRRPGSAGGAEAAAAGKAEPLPPELAALPFEKCLARLERIVDDLEAGEVPLEKGLGLYEEGVQLLRACHQKLDEAERRIQLLVRSGSGFRLEELAAEPAETDAADAADAADEEKTE